MAATREVLLVEDDEATAELERRALARSGIKTQLARGVHEALALLAQRDFKAVLVDHTLPDGDPWRIVEAARAKETCIPVILVTGMGSEAVAVEALRHGVADYIKKADTFWDRLPDVVERAARFAEAEESLRRSNALLRVIAENASDVVSVTDGQGVIQFVSPVCKRILGYEPEEMVGKRSTDFVHPADLGKSGFTEAAGTGSSQYSSVFRCLRKDGTYTWVESSGSFRRRADTGAIYETLSITRDVTERRAAADARTRSEKHLRALVEGNPLGFTVTRDGVIEYANAAALRLFGCDRAEEFVGRVLMDFVHPESRPRSSERKAKIEQGEVVSPNVVRCMRQDGGDILVESSSVLIEIEGAKSILSLLRDVTEGQRVERARAEAEAAVRAALVEKETLLQEIHHRVKNNLQVIASLVNLQASKLEDGGARAALEEVRARVRAIAFLHEKLYQSKDLASVDMGDYVSALVEDVVRMYGAVARGVAIETNVGAVRMNLETAMPCGLMLNELVTNALKHAFPVPGARAPRVVVGLREDPTGYELSVEDNGVGVPAGTRLEDSRSLGWILVRTLAEQLGAAIRIDGKEGVRCTIAFRRT